MPDLTYLPIFAAESTKYKRNYSPGPVQPAGRIFEEKKEFLVRFRPKSIRFVVETGTEPVLRSQVWCLIRVPSSSVIVQSSRVPMLQYSYSKCAFGAMIRKSETVK